MVIHLQRCQRERIAHVRKLQQHKYLLPLQQNSIWLGNCATRIVEQLCNCSCTQIYHSKSLCTAHEGSQCSIWVRLAISCVFRWWKLAAGQELCRAAWQEELPWQEICNMLLLPPNCNLHAATGFSLAQEEENFVRGSFQSSFIQGQKLTGGKWRLTEEQWPSMLRSNLDRTEKESDT